MSTHKPSAQENGYFVREDTDKRERLAIERAHLEMLARRGATAAAQDMPCPRCKTAMRPIDGSVGGSAAICDGCHGTFLDAVDLKAAHHKEGYVTHLLRQVADRAWR